MGYNITEVIKAVVELVIALVLVFVVPWVKKKVGAEKMADFLKWVDIGVAAAEQLFASAAAQEKKQYVIDFLEDKGVSYSELEVDAAIEAAVIKLHNQLYGQSEKDGDVGC